MKKTIELLREIILNEELIDGNLSNLRKKDGDSFSKVDVEPVLIQDQVKFQLTYNYKDKVIHENLGHHETITELGELLDVKFKQSMLFTKNGDYQILISNKGKIRILKKKPTKSKIDLSHNRKKKYIIEDGKPCDFLIRLGVMNKKGKVLAKRYDKFRQINRFLEMVEDVIPSIDKNKTLNIIDFGCGKSYLTFALYHYLVEILELDIDIIGLDLKEDVIQFCNKVALDLDYEKLEFIHGDIENLEGARDVDMVVTLHACDTATDAAIVKAISWDTKVILSVPCCQHEFYDKIENSVLEPMLKHGIIREKLSSLVTDSLRSKILEIAGYQVQLLEFIDMEHTPKNILIRAIKMNEGENQEDIDSYREFKEFWSLEDLYIEKELKRLIK